MLRHFQPKKKLFMPFKDGKKHTLTERERRICCQTNWSAFCSPKVIEMCLNNYYLLQKDACAQRKFCGHQIGGRSISQRCFFLFCFVFYYWKASSIFETTFAFIVSMVIIYCIVFLNIDWETIVNNVDIFFQSSLNGQDSFCVLLKCLKLNFSWRENKNILANIFVNRKQAVVWHSNAIRDNCMRGVYVPLLWSDFYLLLLLFSMYTF